MQKFNKEHAFFHQVILIALILLIAGIQSTLPFSINTQIKLFLAVTLSMGILHGMLDIVLLKSIQFKQTIFLVIYAALALAALLFSLKFTSAALIALLMLSIWHFGEAQQSDDRAKTTSKVQLIFKRFLVGACVLAAPYILANQSLNEILVILLTDANWLSITMMVWGVIAWAWMIAFFVYLIQLTNNKTMSFSYTTLLEISAIWLGFYLLSPLVAFSLYFGAYHAVRHIRDVLTKTKAVHLHKTALVWVGIITFLVLVSIAFILNSQIEITGSSVSSTALLLRSSIVLLVAITLPHSFLITMWRNNFHKSL